MVQQSQPGGGGFGDFLTLIAKLPSPEQVVKELNRLNTNLEKMQPDMAKISKAVDGLTVGDLRMLSQTIQGVKVNELLLAIGQANSNISSLRHHLWGDKT